MTLNEGQQKALEEIEAFLDSPRQLHGLFGYAGTGKSYVLAKILAESSDLYNALIITPTHKAKNVVNGFLKESGLYGKVSVTTVCSALGIRIKKVRGETIAVNDGNPSILGFNHIYLDEMSMVDSLQCNLLMNWLYASSTRKLIALGDSLQLPNPNEQTIPIAEKVGDNYSLLTEIERYKDKELKSIVLKSIMCCEGEQLFSPIASLSKTDGSNPLKRINKTDIENAYGVGKTVLLSHTNRTVKLWNKKLRRLDLGIIADTEDWILDEEIQCNEPIVIDDEIKFNNGTILSVLGIKKVTNLGYDCYELEVNYPDVLRDDVFNPSQKISVVSSTDADRYAKKLASFKANKDWSNYYKLQAINTDVRHRYASTIWSSQGSSYEDVIIVNDFSYLKDTFLQPRLWYVGQSRCKKSLSIAL